ncbi:N-acyl amino acid synthase FeeM domain-containing protein [Devosia sp.]|uniref:N-acyl amino acid synthase FeeM domain-containing protein n=1 Tax=Devosia sp. TaxID=1871048 RepID=UPI00326322EF
MSAATSSSGSASSRFATTLIDLLDRVQYRRVSPADQLDPVYALRYEAYRREDFIPVNSQQITRDAYDDAANCYCYGVYIDEQLVSSVRLHIVTADNPTSPSRAIWPDVLGKILDDGGTYIDPSRFTADHEASLAFPALPYLTLRVAVMACKHFEARYCISSVRPEHAAFYKRVFGSEQLAGEGYWGELTFPVCLYASYLPTMYPRTLERYPFFMSTAEERENLFGPANRPVSAIAPTARIAHRLQLIETLKA